MLWGAEEGAGPHLKGSEEVSQEVVWWAKFKEWPQWSSPFYNFILWICWDIIPVIMFLYLAKGRLSKWAHSHHMNLLEENLNMRATWDSREVFCSWDGGGGHVERAESNLYEVRVTPANSQQEKWSSFYNIRNRIQSTTWMSWRQILPGSLQVNAYSSWHLGFHLVRPWAENPVEPAQNSERQSQEVIHGCWFKPLSLW